ncbi:FxSxx-COOH system tetratricopeptide repeat protein [Embleya scabrispora]|uniref:FxSxx-COOH system tetratricopeptide repeat protein n=1 Tax=Embleya scabrispora TaxID=159449 RepID=UPI0003662EAC|nr:FxSxx-COOH system tetratricopeptide repeat protein [Embleya scabrispora]
MNQDPAAPRPSAPGTVVTFYSFKGGTGRTMALANVAWILAGNGLRVLTMDWDLEAPGLHPYFGPFLGDRGLDSTPGVIDLVRTFDMLEPKPAPEHLREYARVDRYASSLRWNFADGGYIDFVSSGKRTPEYSETVNTYDWRGFYERRDGKDLLLALGADIREHYDYVLIDSRTGFSDTSGITTLLLPDVLVNCFTLSTQAVDGAASVARDVQQAAPRVRILPVPMRVDYSEMIKLEVSRDYARRRFEPFLAHLSAAGREKYWADVEIPYKPFYSYEEILATIGDRPRQDTSLLAAYERLTSVISRGRVESLVAIPEEQRRTLLSRFERVRPQEAEPALARVRIEYAQRDRMWAKWIAVQLRAVGMTVTLRAASVSVEPPPLSAGPAAAGGAPDVVIALLSHEFALTPLAREVLQLAGDTRTDAPRVISVQPLEPVLDEPVLLNLPGATLLALNNLGAEEARAVILGAFALSPPDTAVPADPRFPGRGAKVSNAQPRYGVFTGRDELLENLRGLLGAHPLDGASPPGVALVYGLGGIGKTQIALEYVHRYGAQYDVIWWIGANQHSRIPPALAELGDHLHVAGSTVAERSQAVLTALASEANGPWLLVYDNADSDENPEGLRRYLPARGPGHVIITSRDAAARGESEPFQVDVFSRPESIALLRRRVANLSAREASAVAAELGDLPLAVEQAAAWLRQTGMPVDTYLEQVRGQVGRTLAALGSTGEGTATSDRTPLTAIWRLSVNRLKAERPAAARLLELCAFLSPEPIATRLLYGNVVGGHLADLEPAVRDPMVLGDLIRDLGHYGLARVERETVQVHRLLQAAVREWLAEDAYTYEATRQLVHEALAAARPMTGVNEESPEVRAQYAELLPHLQVSGAIDSDAPAVREWIVGQVRHMWRTGDHEAAVDLGDEVLTRWRERIVPDDADTLRLAAQVANPLRSLGRYADAHDRDKDTLTKQRLLVEPNQRHILVTARNYGADLRALGLYRESFEQEQSTYELSKRAFGPNDPDTLRAANNLSISLNLVGRPVEALRLNEENYRRRRQIFGDNHPATWHSANRLALDRRETGDYQGSLSLLLDTRERQVAKEGESGDVVLVTDRFLTVTHRRMGDAEAALTLSRSILTTLRSRFGELHPDTLACAIGYACDLATLGREHPANYAEAVDIATETYQRYRVRLGDGHPFSLACAGNLAIFNTLYGEAALALRSSTVTLASMEEVLGADHPMTLACRTTRAGALSVLGRHEEAAAEDALANAGFRRIFAPDHPPRVLCSAYNAALERRLSGAPGAEREVSDAMARVESHSGSRHPTYQQMLRGRRINFDVEIPPI